jgi:hypothetical protein
MKAADIFWDEANHVLKIKLSHVRSENSFTIAKPNPSTWTINCKKFIQRIKPKTANGPVYIPVRWDEKEKAFIGTVPKRN